MAGLVAALFVTVATSFGILVRLYGRFETARGREAEARKIAEEGWNAAEENSVVATRMLERLQKLVENTFVSVKSRRAVMN